MPTMDPEEADDFREEIQELTDLVRNDPQWSDLRELLQGQGFDLANTLMVFHVEDEEDGNEYGVLITADRKVIEFQCDTYAEDPAATFKATDVTDDSERWEDYPQVFVALADLG